MLVQRIPMIGFKYKSTNWSKFIWISNITIQMTVESWEIEKMRQKLK